MRLRRAPAVGSGFRGVPADSAFMTADWESSANVPIGGVQAPYTWGCIPMRGKESTISTRQDGCYVVTSKLGDCSIVQLSAGRIVECLEMGGRVANPPKRQTWTLVAATFADFITAAAKKRDDVLMQVLMEELARPIPS